MKGRRLAYLSLETPHEGQANHTHIHEMIAGLRECGWTVTLYAASGGGASSRGRLRWLRTILSYLAVQARLLAALARFDALFVRAHPAAAPAALLAGLRGRPVFQEINGRPVDIGVSYPLMRRAMAVIGWLYRVQLRRAAHVFAVTPGLVEWCRREAGHARCSLVENGANTRLFTPDGPDAGEPPPYVLFVGGLVAWHGIATMLAAAQHPRWPQGVRLVVAGDGPERGRLAALPAGAPVRWLGRQPYGQVPALLRGALAALCVIEDPSGRSATGVAPLKLFEAMACGTPVIVSDLPHQGDLVRRIDAGSVIPAGDAAALAAAVAALAAAPEAARAQGARGAAFVAREASWLARARQVAAIMQQAGAEARP